MNSGDNSDWNSSINTAANPKSQRAVYFATASPEWQIRLTLEVPSEATVGDVIARARAELGARSDAEAQAALSEAPWQHGACGVFGELCGRDRQIVAGDRIELYLPLRADPKLTRRRRAEAVQTAKARNPLTVKRRG